MNKLALFLIIFLPFYCLGQVNETFLDNNFTDNPRWSGSESNFQVNAASQLQSKATTTSTSYLFTPSQAFAEAVWECWVKINYSTSSSNYASIYLTSDNNDIANGCRGYYVQIGGTNDEVSLYVQEGTKKTKLIDGTDKRTDGTTVEIRIKVTRSEDGTFKLYSKLPAENVFYFEGEIKDNVVKQSTYFGLLYSNTSSTGSAYFFDDIIVTGNKVEDKESPFLISANLTLPNKLELNFSEAMDVSSAKIKADNEFLTITSQLISADKTSITLDFDFNFEKGKSYEIEIFGFKDVAGNLLESIKKSIGIEESISVGDLIINEIMFENPLNSLEYIEIYNASNKILDISGLIFSTRKTDGTLNTGNKIPQKTLLMPNQYLALTENADSVKNYHRVPTESNIVSSTWSSLNNESASIVLCNATKDTIYDECRYNAKWHHVLIKNPKGVALEKINPLLSSQSPESWHSAASETNYGTPGYKNSQYRDIENETSIKKTLWLEPEAFSPDNDGTNDVCIIRYKTDSYGYIANSKILSPNGNVVYTLITNELLSSDGFFTWDGKTDTGKNVNVGIYVLYFEMFNPENGQRKRLKLPIVVSSI